MGFTDTTPFLTLFSYFTIKKTESKRRSSRQRFLSVNIS